VKGSAAGAPGVRACLCLWVSAAILVALAGRAALAAPADDLPDPAPGPAPPATAPSTAPSDADDEPMPPAMAPTQLQKARPPLLPPPPPTASPPPSPPAASPSPPAAPPSPPAGSPSSPAASPAPAPIAGPIPWPTVPSEAGTGPASGTAASPAAPAIVGPPEVAAHRSRRQTWVGLSGEAQLFIDGASKKTARLPQVVLSVTHRPTDWFRIVAAVEADDGSSVAMQQAFFEVSPVRAVGLRAGLMIVPLGLGNLVPEPTSYLTVDRPLTDQLIIPTTWRELGVGLFGEIGPGLRYQGEVLSGLDGSGFTAGAPLWGGRGDGSGIAVHDAAFAGRLELADLPPGLVIGGGGYYGGAAAGLGALSSLHVGVLEADARYRQFGFDLRVEVARLYIVNSYLVNNYQGLLGQDAVPARGRGFYGQAGYDLLRLGGLETKQELVMFAGYENVNPRSEMSPYNYNPPSITGPGELSPRAPSPAKSFVRGGIDYRPWPAIALKADVQVALDAEGPPPAAPMVMAGAPGTPRPIGADVADAARGRTRVGLAIAFNF
jgi:hypothetical protein